MFVGEVAKVDRNQSACGVNIADKRGYYKFDDPFNHEEPAEFLKGKSLP
jgi:hypothetical protein